MEISAKKRKHDEDEKGSKEKEEKNKHKKEKKKETDDAAQKESEVKKEEEEDKLKGNKKEDESKNVKSQEEERPHYSKKDEDEKYKYSKKDDKYRYKGDEEDRGKYTRRIEDDSYSRDEEYRYRYRRDCHERSDDHPKYVPRNDEDNKYKYSKYSDSRSKYDRDPDEGKSKTQRETFKTSDLGKPAVKTEVCKPEPLPKTYDQSKIICGPSPAMRAKLRKQSLEAGKPAPVTTTTSFGKFTWKKRENLLAKEAEKVAAEFIKDDEAAAKQPQQVSVEDSFAKSMAVAKEIADKLSGQNTMAPSWVSNGTSRGRIRPNLPAPAAVLRRTTMMGKPASLNTFLSMGPQHTGVLDPPPKDDPLCPDPLTKALNAQKALLETKAVPPVGKPGSLEVPAASKNESFETKSPPLVSGLPPAKDRPVPPVSKLSPVQAKPALAEGKPARSEVNPAPLVFKSETRETKPAPSQPKPTQSSLIKVVSDVAAPGVPESEQTRTVFVKPPPFMNMGDGSQKSEKLRSSLAAARAQDLFGIFYSSIGQSGPLPITKSATISRSAGGSTNKPPQLPKAQPQGQSQTQSQTPTKFYTSPQPNSNNSTSDPQLKPPADVQSQSQPPTKVHASLQSESNISAPGSKTQPQPPAEVHKTSTISSPPSIQTQVQTLVDICTSPQPDSNNILTSTQTKPKSDIQIASVWSLQPTLPTVPVIAPSKTTSHTIPPKLIPPAHSEPQNQTSAPETECQIASQTKPAEKQLESHAPQITQTPAVLLPESQPDQDTQQHSHPEMPPEMAPEPEPQPKPGPKTRGKTTPTKKTPSAPRPVRQTRSQTRYQTRHQQQQNQSEPQPELVSGDSNSAALDPKSLDTSDPSSGLQPTGEEPCKQQPQVMDVTPETLGLPSDLTSLDFEYDFNFE